MPTIRAIRPTDIVSLIAFFRHDSLREMTAQLWPRVWESSGSRALKDLLSRLVPHPGNTQVWVYLAGGIRGLVVASPRAGKIAWDVEDLFVIDGDRAIGAELLEHISGEAARRGARKIFLSTPVEAEVARLANKAGFVNYTSESLYAMRPPAAVENGSGPPARPRLRSDAQALFHLYSHSVPCRVRSAEAMTMDEWLSLEKGTRLWAPSLAGSRRHYVWENGNGLAAWMRLSVGGRSQLLELLVHPSHGEIAEELLRYSLAQASSRLSLYLSVREYQPDIISATRKYGSTEVASYLIFARELAVRIPNRAWVPARA